MKRYISERLSLQTGHQRIGNQGQQHHEVWGYCALERQGKQTGFYTKSPTSPSTFMPILIILVGLPGSGKSTWAKEQKAKYPNRFVLVSRDEIRKIVNFPYRKDRTNLEREERNRQIMQAIEVGKDVILDETNLFESHRNTIRNGDIDITTVYYKSLLHVPVEVSLIETILELKKAKECRKIG